VKRVLILLGLSIAATFFSCKNHRLQRTLEEFQFSTIAIPEGIKQIGVCDSLAGANEGLARLVVYVDSLSCSPCAVTQMYKYNEVIDLYEKTKGAFYPLFIFSPSHDGLQETETSLQLYRLNYPILLDDEGMFSAANPHIPADSRFHTFLLDKKGEVILVGDPVKNPDLWELYKTAIAELIENGGALR